jgi:hypothetical protein
VKPLPTEYWPEGLSPAGAPEEWSAGTQPVVRRTPLPTELPRLAASLRKGAIDLRRLPVDRIIAALGAVHAAWSAPSSDLRSTASTALHRVTGYPVEVIDLSLRNLFQSLSEAALRDWLPRAGLQPEWLDGRSGDLLAFGPGLTAVVSSGNIPGAALPSVLQALLFKSPCLVKTSSAEPVFLPLYARSLAEKAPELARALAVTGWRGGDTDREAALLARVDALIAYGADATLSQLRRHLPPHARLIGYGHRISFSAIAREWLTAERAAESARLAATDLALFDQQGCLSPQALYVERGAETTPAAFAELLTGALAELQDRWPRRKLEPAEAAAIHQYRAVFEMRSLSDERVRLWRSAGTEWTVALQPSASLEPCVLNRTAVLHEVDDLAEVPSLVGGQGPTLISAALGAPEARLASLAPSLGAVGVTRIALLGQAQLPSDPLFHDGANALQALARFARIERFQSPT